MTEQRPIIRQAEPVDAEWISLDFSNFAGFCSPSGVLTA